MRSVFLVAGLLALACAQPGGIRDEPPVGLAEQALASGMRAVRAGDTELGVLALRRALDAAPSSAHALRAEAHRWIGHAFVREGDPEGALTEFQLALAESPSDPWTHTACGTAWSALGDFDAAQASFTRALELDPQHIQALQWRGETWLELARPAAAVNDFSAALLSIEGADDAALASFGGQRAELLERTLRLRAEAFSATGDEARAALDRARREELLRDGR